MDENKNLKIPTVFLTTKTKNKKFFFQQILLIFAVLLKDIQAHLLYFFHETPLKQYSKLKLNS
jgi:hypothetical protein